MANNPTRSKKLNGLHPFAYMGAEPSTPLEFVIYDDAPTSDDYENFNVGAIWLQSPEDTPATNVPWMLARKEGLQSTWITFGGSGILTLTGDTGSAVGADGSNNINSVSGFSALSFDGSPMANTLFINSDGTIALTYTTDSGTAQASSNTVTVSGGTSIETSGSGNTVTISVDGGVPLEYETDSGTVVASNNVINVFGGVGIDTTASGNTVTISISGDVATSYAADTGTAVPAAGVLEVFGGLNIDTAGSGNTITIKTPTLAEGVVYIDGSGVFTSLGTADDGEVLIGATGSTPDWANITSTGATVTITNGPNSINLEAGASQIESAFFAYKSTTITAGPSSGITLPYYYVCDTELYDTNSDYNATTGIYTAPSAGIYFFGTAALNNFESSSLPAKFIERPLGLEVSSGATYQIARPAEYANNPVSNKPYLGANGGLIISLEAMETVRPYFDFIGYAARRIGVNGGSNPLVTYFYGYKVGNL